MLNPTPDREECQTLMAGRDNFPIKIEAGNPFMLSQELQLPTEAPSSIGSHLISSATDEHVEAYRKRQIYFASSRVNRMPKNVHLLNNLGIAHLNSGSLDKAIQCFEKAIQIDADHFPSIANLAKAYFLKGEIDRALKIYLDTERKQPQNVSLLNNIAQLLLAKREFKLAYEYLERVLKEDGNNIAALNNIGTALLLENKVQKAIAFYRRALLVKSDFPAALNNLGVSFALVKSRKKAVKHFLAAWSLNRSSVGYVLNLAQAYQQIGLQKNAIKVLEDYLTRGFENQKVRDALALSYASLKDYGNSLKHLTKSLKTIETTGDNPQEKARIYNNIAVVSQCMRDFNAAEKFYDLCWENEVLKSPIPIYNAIELYFREDKDEYAKELIDRGMKEFPVPDDPRLLSYLGRYYFEIQKYEESLEIFSRVMTLEPKIVYSFAISSVIEIEINRNWEKAYGILTKGLLTHPNESGLLNNLAYGYLMQNETTKAREILENAKAQDNIFIIATRGLLLIKEGDVQEGLHLYNSARSIALENGDEKTATLIEQKKYLELGKYHLKTGNVKEAARLLKKTLAIKAKYEYFVKEAEEIINTIE